MATRETKGQVGAHQRRHRRTKQRYQHDYTSAEEVRGRFRDDLSAAAAQQVQRELERLGLPTVHDVEDEFERLCRDLGIGQ